jgi:hypothetical protein
MLLIIRRGNFRQKPSHHFNDICNWHTADFILQSGIVCCSATSGMTSTRKKILGGKALDMGKIPNFDGIPTIAPNIVE